MVDDQQNFFMWTGIRSERSLINPAGNPLEREGSSYGTVTYIMAPEQGPECSLSLINFLCNVGEKGTLIRWQVVNTSCAL